MSFGDTSRGFNEWALDDNAAEPLFRQAVELGITFWDTANAYGYGTSEEIVGRAISKYTRREDIVLATKVFFKIHDGPGGSGLSRRAILEQLDDSLRRLGTDYIDLYQIHRFDPATPVEESMEALHDMVKAGKVRYLGASSMWAWQFAKMQHIAQLHGWTRFVSMQTDRRHCPCRPRLHLRLGPAPLSLDAGHPGRKLDGTRVHRRRGRHRRRHRLGQEGRPGHRAVRLVRRHL
jgi:aryl-alcohol dehydrogenase-like predicted oxidoreductase